jgi:cytochrome oxidase Cu insertion factor (SCO1/SenC/PrrC family)
MSNDAPLPSRRTGSHSTLWLVLAVCLAPFVASFVAYYFYQPQGRVNYGSLMDTRKLPVEPLAQAGGGGFMLRQLEGKWIFLVVDDAACDAYCEKKLWQIRQVRKTQGKYPERIERLWLLTGDGQPEERLRREYEGTWMVRAAGSALLAALPYEGSPSDHIYLIDPLGNLVLRYPRDADPSRIRKDIARLLRVSRIG